MKVNTCSQVAPTVTPKLLKIIGRKILSLCSLFLAVLFYLWNGWFQYLSAALLA